MKPGRARSEDVRMAGVHDASAPAEIMLYETLGFAAPRRERRGCFGGARHPLAVGCPSILAGAFSVEVILLARQALPRSWNADKQPNFAARPASVSAKARGVALAECSGGEIGSDSALAAVTILSK